MHGEHERLLGWGVAAVLTACLIAVSAVAVVVRDVHDGVTPVVFAKLTDYRRTDLAVWVPGGTRDLTDDKSSALPSWSPDGRQVAFIRGSGLWEECCGFPDAQIWVMNADGTDAHPVSEMLSGTTISSAPHWTNDGALLYVPNGGPRIYRLDLDSGSSTVMTARVIPSWGQYLAFSPDDTRLAVAKRDALVIVNLNDGSREQVAEGVFRPGASMVSWSPDGRWLVLQGTTLAGDSGIWAWDLEREQVQQVSPNLRVTYTWTGPDLLLNCRDTENTSYLYVTDLSDNETHAVKDDSWREIGMCPGEAIDGLVGSPSPIP